MQHIKNLKKYTPEEFFLGENVIYLKDENGADWYGAQKLFSAKTVKLAYDMNGIICAMTHDVSMLWPIDLSVVELNTTKIPKGCMANGEWIYNGEKIIQRAYSSEELKASAAAEQSARIASAAKEIVPLQDAVDLDMATDTEKTRLTDWKKYRVMLNRLDITTAPDIDWPSAPDA